MHIEVPRVKFEKLSGDFSGENSEKIRERVEKARLIQKNRFSKTKTVTNSEMDNEQIKIFCPLNIKSIELLRKAVSSFQLSARAYYRLIKVARTIADLEESQEINPSHIAEAIQYRFRDE